MNILIASYCSEGSNANYYVRVLRDSLQEQGLDVTVSVDEFWNPSRKYDIIHFQWPGDLTGYNGRKWMLSALRGRIATYEAQGVKFAMTRHNVGKYYDESPFNKDLYQEIEKASDIIVHLGNSSLTTWPVEHCKDTVRHVVTTIPFFPNIDRSVSQKEARTRLGWRDNDKVALAFGDFRADEEVYMVLNAARRMKKNGVRLVAPRLFPTPIRGHGKQAGFVELKHRLRFIRYGLFFEKYGFVDDERMTLLFAASDVVFIQRKFTLNSGNVSMGFYFGKVVVGPDTGNVGEILKMTNNPTFDPNSDESIANALLQGFELAKKGKGVENQRYADMNWQPVQVAKIIADAYRAII